MRKDALLAELSRTAARGRHEILSPGWVSSVGLDAGGSPPNIALATQCLPNPIDCVAPSISAAARLAGEQLIERLRDHADAWRLHVFTRFPPGNISGPRRGELIRAAIIDFLRRKQRRLLRSLLPDPAAPWQQDELLVQLGLMDSDRVALSFLPVGQRRLWRRVVSRFPGGEVEVADEPQAPSRAYRKLAEVLLRMNRSFADDEQCVDLGSSPGSWAWLAIQRSAQVTAIDRSPLRRGFDAPPTAAVCSGRRLQVLPRGAGRLVAQRCDRLSRAILELLEMWLSRRWCRQFCVTIKFRGQEEYSRLDQCKSLLDSLGAEYCLRRLTHNRNEVTAYGYAAGTASSDLELC